LVRGALDVDDESVMKAMALAWRHFKLVVEPGGAAALAAVLSGAIPVQGRTVCAVCSGGNVEAAVFRAALERFA
jgi:threonine dehydratase